MFAFADLLDDDDSPDDHHDAANAAAAMAPAPDAAPAVAPAATDADHADVNHADPAAAAAAAAAHNRLGVQHTWISKLRMRLGRAKSRINTWKNRQFKSSAVVWPNLKRM